MHTKTLVSMRRCACVAKRLRGTTPACWRRRSSIPFARSDRRIRHRRKQQMGPFIIPCQRVTPSQTCAKKIRSVGKTAIELPRNYRSLITVSHLPSSSRLEIYEQSCAVDSVTKKCAGKTSTCRTALLGIIGTPLRTLCACQGSDLQQLYECLGWQRLLWLNPCVGECRITAASLMNGADIVFCSRVAERFPREAAGGTGTAGDHDDYDHSANDTTHFPDHHHNASHTCSRHRHHEGARKGANAVAARNCKFELNYFREGTFN